jgi:ADP-ribose pyrophosphatase YjhB (NUDIX family)
LGNVEGIFPVRKLPFSSFEIDMTSSSLKGGKDMEIGDFSVTLQRTVQVLQDERKLAVYLKIDMQHSHLIPSAGLLGFQFHHAEGDEATLLKWLPEDVECLVPPFGTHHVGVAGALVKDDHLLVVREKSKLNNWKLPGGYVNLNEEISAAAVREVREETGIRATFRSLLTFRNQHDVQFGRGDIYAVCRLDLEAGSTAGPETKISIDDEIDDAQWMPLSTFEAQNKNRMLDYVVALLQEGHPGLRETLIESTVPHRKAYKLYYPPTASIP